MRSSPEPHEWAASERAEKRNILASMQAIYGIFVMMLTVPVCLVMVLAGIGGQ